MKGALERILKLCRTYYYYGSVAPLSLKQHQVYMDRASLMGTSGLRGTFSDDGSLVKLHTIFLASFSEFNIVGRINFFLSNIWHCPKNNFCVMYTPRKKVQFSSVESVSDISFVSVFRITETVTSLVAY